jgi:thiamine-phosphate pyrophosphorylase
MTSVHTNQEMTSAACRILRRCLSDHRQTSATESLFSHLLSDESLAGAELRRFGMLPAFLIPDGTDSGSGLIDGQDLDLESIAPQRSDVDCRTSDSPMSVAEFRRTSDAPHEIVMVLERAIRNTRRSAQQDGITTAQLLLALAETDTPTRNRLAAHGITPQHLRDQLGLNEPETLPAIPVDIQLRFSSGYSEPIELSNSDHGSIHHPDSALNFENHDRAMTEEHQTIRTDRSAGTIADASVWRILDAALNRAREGLRVLEDHARFISDDRCLSGTLKAVRHLLVASECSLMLSFNENGSGHSERLRFRDTAGDVGTDLHQPGESHRNSLEDVLTANYRRVQESLRSLEEYGKLVSPQFSAEIKQLRYQVYESEKQHLCSLSPEFDTRSSSAAGFSSGSDRTRLLNEALVCVLITERFCRLPWQSVVESLLPIDGLMFQFREKDIADAEFLRRAVWLSNACRSAGRLCIINDRPDVARMAGADGVHLGQDDLPIQSARDITGNEILIGVSTHRLSEAKAAVIAGADYIGVGPVFPSRTKSFQEFPGVNFAREVVSDIQIPWFAIGGIDQNNIKELEHLKSVRVACGSGISSCEAPAEHAENMVRAIRSFRTDH